MFVSVGMCATLYLWRTEVRFWLSPSTMDFKDWNQVIGLVHQLLTLFFVCMYICASHMCLVPTEAREYVRSLGTGLTNGCELLCGRW